MSTTTNYNFPLNDDATTLFSNWWQTINGNNPNSLAVLVDSAIAGVQTAVNNLANLHFVVVATLPTQDIQTNAIYLVPKQTSETDNYYDEYIYYNNSWELIGTTQVDLSSYVTLTGSESISNKTITLSTYNGYTLAGACAKSVDASITDVTSTNLPTSQAVANYIGTYMSTHYVDGDNQGY